MLLGQLGEALCQRRLQPLLKDGAQLCMEAASAGEMALLCPHDKAWQVISSATQMHAVSPASWAAVACLASGVGAAKKKSSSRLASVRLAEPWVAFLVPSVPYNARMLQCSRLSVGC